MQLKFFGNDLGIFVFGQEILKQFPQARISFYLTQKSSVLEYNTGGGCTSVEIQNKNFISENNFWEIGLLEILKLHTRFGRIGIMCDSRNIECQNFFAKINLGNFNYHPKDKKRAEKNPVINLFNYKLLKNFANEGLTDTVEFRRLARKYIRQAKSHKCDSLYFPEIIFGEEKTKKILQHLAGSQMKIFTTADFFEIPLSNSYKEEKKRDIKIFYNPKNIDLADLKVLSEKFLKTKISENDFSILA